ncbi:MAG: hypothetical protein Q8P29_04260 [Candidatus Levybacteria bacterium]|nr:hypothetical protein [Candidatus Levybacteria bacterium]MDZ4228515.1 hypothetical protein [Candidatus Levybacteria bacterium]
MEYLSFSIPGYGQIDSDPPGGVPTGGLFNTTGGAGTGQNIISSLIIFIVVVAILFTLWEIGKGGLDIIQSRGVKEKMKSGRERVMYGVFGLIMLFLSFFFISVISAFFGFDIIPFLKFR